MKSLSSVIEKRAVVNHGISFRFIKSESRGHLRVMLIIVLLACCWLGLSVGAARVDFALPLELVFNWVSETENNLAIFSIITDIRFPRVLLALFVGAALAMSGASLQGVCRNPLADPGLLGISSGAAVGAVSWIVFADQIVVLESVHAYLLPGAAIIGAALTSFAIYRLAQVNGSLQITTLLLAGVAINAFAGAIIGLLSYTADDQALRLITFWMMGSLAGATWDALMIAAPILIICFKLIHDKRHALNLFLLGEANARYVGVDVAQVKNQLLWINAIAVGVAVALSGIIGFIGLVVPHILRVMTGSDYRFLIANSALLGAALLILSDLFARMIVSPAEVPIGVVTALLGAPFFTILLLQQKKKMALSL